MKSIAFAVALLVAGQRAGTPLNGVSHLPKGALVIGGGGNEPTVVSRFIGLAGGRTAKFVLIPTARKSDEGVTKVAEQWKELFGVRNVTVLNTRDRKMADTESFVAPLRQANGVWFLGGRQWRLVDAYLGTRTQHELEAVLVRGGVIGGSSAGASIQGSYLVRGSPRNNRIMMAKGYEQGFGYLRNVAIDQHVLTRKRVEDLVPVIDAHPELLGIGLDEPTAIVVRGDEFEVIGESKVAIYDSKNHAGKRYYFLSVGDRFNLKTRLPLAR